MNRSIKSLKAFMSAHKKELTAGGWIAVGLAVIGLLIGLVVYNNPPTVVYEPTNACDLLTPAKAQSLLGDEVISLNTALPVLSGDVTTSKCGYTDRNPDTDNMKVAALAVRSGINDEGIKQNKSEFAASKSASNTVAVPHIGDDAYFNPDLGQLNILTGRDWMIFSYGVGTAPENHTLANAVTLAQLVLPGREFSLPQF